MGSYILYFGSPLVWCVSDFVKIYEKGNDQKLAERLQIINLQNFCCDEAYTRTITRASENNIFRKLQNQKRTIIEKIICMYFRCKITNMKYFGNIQSQSH